MHLLLPHMPAACQHTVMQHPRCLRLGLGLQERMRELLGQSLTPEADEAALEELAALEAQEAEGEAAALPEVPKVRACQQLSRFESSSSCHSCVMRGSCLEVSGCLQYEM